jgi:hypothetical protein
MERWTRFRKQAVLQAITTGELSRAEAIAKYELSEEELYQWERLYNRFGTAGLRATRVQVYRELVKHVKPRGRPRLALASFRRPGDDDCTGS